MRNKELLFRVMAVTAVATGGCGHVEPKKSVNPADPSVAKVAELNIDTAEALASYSPISSLPGLVEIQSGGKVGFESIPDTPETLSEIIRYPLDATTRYTRHASVKFDANGNRIFDRFTPGDPSFAVSPEDLPFFGKDWSSENYIKTVKWFNLLNSARYHPDENNTYCNIFLWDVTRAMGVEIPHYVDGAEMNTVWIWLWLTGEGEASEYPSWKWGKGSDVGWFEVTGEEAQNLANNGIPTVAIRAMPGRGMDHSGHVAVVIPGQGTRVDGVFYPSTVQSGAYMWDVEDGKTAFDSFRNLIMAKIVPGEILPPRYFSNQTQYELIHNGDGLSSVP